MDVEFLIDVITSFIIIHSIESFKDVLDILRICVTFVNIFQNIIILRIINVILNIQKLLEFIFISCSFNSIDELSFLGRLEKK